MAFTTFSALKTAILDAMADSLSGAPCTGEYEINGRKMKYRNYEELQRLYDWVCIRASKESGVRRSFGRYRRF